MKDYELIEKEIDGKIHFYAKFTDGQGIEQTTELDREVYSVIHNSQKEISSQARQDRRYGLCSFDESIGDTDIIDEAEQTEELLKKVWQQVGELTEVQQRRLHQYFDEKKTFKQIAEIEGVGWQRIQKSIDLALSYLRAKNYF
jgi:DNA-directed RNA polymerase specialized sigma subunit